MGGRNEDCDVFWSLAGFSACLIFLPKSLPPLHRVRGNCRTFCPMSGQQNPECVFSQPNQSHQQHHAALGQITSECFVCLFLVVDFSADIFGVNKSHRSTKTQRIISNIDHEWCRLHFVDPPWMTW
jgi:hypothetical protein